MTQTAIDTILFLIRLEKERHWHGLSGLSQSSLDKISFLTECERQVKEYNQNQTFHPLIPDDVERWLEFLLQKEKEYLEGQLRSPDIGHEGEEFKRVFTEALLANKRASDWINGCPVDPKTDVISSSTGNKTCRYRYPLGKTCNKPTEYGKLRCNEHNPWKTK